MNGLPMLSVLIFLPFAFAALLALAPARSAASLRGLELASIAGSIVIFALSIVLTTSFDRGSGDFQFVEDHVWIESLNLRYVVGVDGVSVLFMPLSALLIVVCFLISYGVIEKRVKEYCIVFFVLEGMLIGTFAALDLVLFYVFFEGTLIPMFLIIGIWGSDRRIYSAVKFFLFTFFGSVFMLIAFIVLYLYSGTSDMRVLGGMDFPVEMQRWLWFCFLASFAIKLPMWPLHTWLPDAHVEAPTAGSVILAGILLKFGGYGFIRFSLDMLPAASEAFAPLIFALGVVAIVYTSLVALAQTDMKKLIAYSSVAHMGYVSIGLFTLQQAGVEGAIFQMLSHGVVSAALFVIVGLLYHRGHTKSIAAYGGLANDMPVLSFSFMVFLLASVGLPGTSGFPGEFLVVLAAYDTSVWLSLLVASGMIWGAVYMLYLYKRVVFGQRRGGVAAALPDLNAIEILACAPLLLLAIWMGVNPSAFTSFMSSSVGEVMLRF